PPLRGARACAGGPVARAPGAAAAGGPGRPRRRSRGFAATQVRAPPQGGHASCAGGMVTGRYQLVGGELVSVEVTAARIALAEGLAALQASMRQMLRQRPTAGVRRSTSGAGPTGITGRP